MFPKPPTDTIDWSFVGLQGFDKTSHIECTYSNETKNWSDPVVVKDPYIRVHGLSPGLNYGQQCFEGLRASRSADNKVYLFRPERHAQRMAHSARMVSIPPISEEIFLASVEAAVIANSEFIPPHDSSALLYIWPVAFGSSGHLLLSAPAEHKLCVYVQPGTVMHGELAVDAVVLEDFDRAAPRGVGHAKIGGNYPPVMRWSRQAQQQGYALTLHLDSITRSEIDEFSSCAFAGIKTDDNGTTFILPSSPNAIQSITSECCAEIAKDLGWTVEQRTLKWDELSLLDEVIAMGSATLVIPVKSITRPSILQVIEYCADPRSPGPKCSILRDQLKAIAHARDLTTQKHWLKLVQPIENGVKTKGNTTRF